MVQREVADRFFAAPSTKAYGAVSVLVQLAAERTGFHPVARTVFRPPPNVDSALVAFRRTQLPDEFARVKQVVEASFAHRRKTLPNSLAFAGLASRERGRGRARDDRPRAGRRAPRRSSRTSSSTLARCAVTSASAPAKLNLALVVGPARDDGKHEVATVLQRVDLADRVARRARRPRSPSPASPSDTLVARSPPTRSPTAAGVEPRLARDDHEADPGRVGPRRRQLRRRDRASARERDARLAAAGRRAPHAGRGARRRRSLLPRRRASARPRRWLGARAARPAAGLLGRARAPDRREPSPPPPPSTERSTSGTGPPAGTGVATASPTRSRPSAGRATSPRSRRTTSRRRRSPTSCARLGAFRADVSGAGPVVYGLFHHRRQAEAARRALRGVGRTWLTVPVWYG